MKGIERDLMQIDNSLEPRKDPFVGYLSGPLPDLKVGEAYLKLLPAYRTNLSPLLKGISVGIAHGYFLVGPFYNLGPLRNTPSSNFAGFLASASLIIILTSALWIYGKVTYNGGQQQNTVGSDEVNFLSARSWAQFCSGFALGGFGGITFACLMLVLIA